MHSGGLFNSTKNVSSHSNISNFQFCAWYYNNIKQTLVGNILCRTQHSCTRLPSQAQLFIAVKAKQCAPACMLATGHACIHVIPAPYPPSPPPAASPPPILPRSASGQAAYAPPQPPAIPVTFGKPVVSASSPSIPGPTSNRMFTPSKTTAYFSMYGSTVGFMPAPGSALGFVQGYGYVGKKGGGYATVFNIGGPPISSMEQKSPPADPQGALLATHPQNSNGENKIQQFLWVTHLLAEGLNLIQCQ